MSNRNIVNKNNGSTKKLVIIINIIVIAVIALIAINYFNYNRTYIRAELDTKLDKIDDSDKIYIKANEFFGNGNLVTVIVLDSSNKDMEKYLMISKGYIKEAYPMERYLVDIKKNEQIRMMFGGLNYLKLIILIVIFLGIILIEVLFLKRKSNKQF